MTETEFVLRPPLLYRVAAWDVRSAVLLAAGVASAALAVTAGGVAAGVLTTVGPWTVTPDRFADFLGAAFVAFALPFGAFEWWRVRRAAAVEARLPDFLGDLASLHKAGLTLMAALRTAAEGDYGPLTPHVRQAADQVRWGVPVLDALDHLRSRIATPLADRTLTVVVQAGRAGGDFAEVLSLAAGVARRLGDMRTERQRELLLYVLIVYVATSVFLVVELALLTTFMPRMLEAGASGPGFGFGGGTVDLAPFRLLMVTGALVQGAGNGLVAGVMTGGSVSAGVKHAAALTALTLAAFWFFA